MAKYKKLLLDAFKPAFKERGFKKKAATWYRETEEVVQVFNVQTSQWSECYYFNAGIYLRALGRELTPPDYRCHIRTRIPDGDGAIREQVNSLSDFGGLTENQARKRISELKELISPLAFEWLDAFRDLAHVKRELSASSINVWSREVWKVVGLKAPRD